MKRKKKNEVTSSQKKSSKIFSVKDTSKKDEKIQKT